MTAAWRRSARRPGPRCRRRLSEHSAGPRGPRRTPRSSDRSAGNGGTCGDGFGVRFRRRVGGVRFTGRRARASVSTTSRMQAFPTRRRWRPTTPRPLRSLRPRTPGSPRRIRASIAAVERAMCGGKASVLLAGGSPGPPDDGCHAKGCGKSVRAVRGDRLLLETDAFVLCWWRWAASAA